MAVNQNASLFQIGTAVFGGRVDRAAATLPQGTQAALFTVSGGRVAILGIVGEVTTIIQTTANATKIVSNPTTGTDVDLCATLDITADEVGCLYGITGTFATALVGANAGATLMCATPVVVPPGTIDLNCAGSATGAVKWSLYYVPLAAGATVVAA
jgi:hypothetical protein